MPKKKITLPPPADASVPLSSMIDIVFLLLIYFILTQKPVIEEIPMNVDLPAPSSQPNNINQEPPFTINVGKYDEDKIDEIDKALKAAKTQVDYDKVKQREGREIYYALNGGQEFLSFDQLDKRLGNLAKVAPKTTIVIHCDPNAKHKKLIMLLDLCAKHGLSSLNITDEPIEFVPDKKT